MTERLTFRTAVVAVLAVLLVGVFFLVRPHHHTREVTAHFPRAVSIYKGSDVRVLGVSVGKVTAVIPEGNSVRVEMQYDADVNLPPDAKAVIITPTLVSDRYVQLTPVWTKGPAMKDGGDIALPDTGVPVELDRIYASLQDLSEALGPNGVNKDGTLSHLLHAGATALDGQGARGNLMIKNLSAAAETFGKGAGPLFDTVDQLATFTTTLADNDKLVQAFVKDLAGVSSNLASERVQIQRTLAAVARAVGTVKDFVHDNRAKLVDSVDRLSRVMKTINSERDSIDTALSVAPVAINNLTLAYNQESGTIGSRIGVQGQLWDADGFLCSIVQQSSIPQAGKDLACSIFKQLLEPIENNIPANPPSGKGAATDPSTGSSTGSSTSTGTATSAGQARQAALAAQQAADQQDQDRAAQTEMQYASGSDATLTGLLGGTP